MLALSPKKQIITRMNMDYETLPNIATEQLTALRNQQINLTDIMEDMFMVLTPKEKEVIVKRFSLDNKPRMTLESIGAKFSVTRERIRQIEKIALGKLKRTVTTSKLQIINQLASAIIKEQGGVLLESKLVTEILKAIYSHETVDANIIRLALNINTEISKTEKSNVFHSFWRHKDISMSMINQIISTGIKILKKRSEVHVDEKFAQELQKELDKTDEELELSTVISAMEVDKRIKRTKEGFGLMTWRHINPKSIRDKAYIILKSSKKPLHFVDIANKIATSDFDKKVVTTQAVHNELIRYDQFVLVGRGLYALKEWGYKKGTVADVIEDLLRKKSPLTKKEIIDGVLKQRQVKKGTISLNLQKKAQFVRVGRAVYKLDASKSKD